MLCQFIRHSNEEFLVQCFHPPQGFFLPLLLEGGEDGLVGGLHAGGAVEAADEPGVDAGRVEVMQARLGCNSIHFFWTRVWLRIRPKSFLPAAEQVYKSFFFSFSFSNPRFFVFMTIHCPFSG